ncbi:hypothetical protein PhaeoP10_02021 [Phaeobacter inhibens]|nr:hypothetical protein PhaeoP10_02021 [Phaeobacter inhibens]
MLLQETVLVKSVFTYDNQPGFRGPAPWAVVAEFQTGTNLLEHNPSVGEVYAIKHALCPEHRSGQGTQRRFEAGVAKRLLR